MSAIDPVCGTEVSSEHAYAIEGYAALSYHFCSKDCHQRFLARPGSLLLN